MDNDFVFVDRVVLCPEQGSGGSWVGLNWSPTLLAAHLGRGRGLSMPRWETNSNTHLVRLLRGEIC